MAPARNSGRRGDPRTTTAQSIVVIRLEAGAARHRIPPPAAIAPDAPPEIPVPRQFGVLLVTQPRQYRRPFRFG